MEPIRILHMIGSLEMGGSQAMIMNIYRNIDREKIQFDFVIDKNREGFFEKEITNLGGKIYKMPSFRGTNIHEIRNSWDVFFKEHLEYKILHSHVRSYASLYIPIAKKHGVKTIIHSHSTSNGSGFSALVKAVMQYPLRYQADYFFGCSMAACEWLFGKKIAKNEKCYVIKNGIDTKNFIFDKDKRNRIRKHLEISESTFVIGHVGRFIEAKNHDFLIEMYSKVYKELPESKLLLIGDGELKNKIIDKCSQYQIQNNVIFTGAIANTQDYYSAMDVFCFPSIWEGLGIAAIEAQVSGLKCILSNEIPNEIDIGLGLVKKIDLNTDINDWVDNILNSRGGLNRNVKFDVIKKSGYDIADSTKWLQKFYLSII